MKHLPQENRNWTHINGYNSVLLVAAHAYPHERNGRLKPRDVHTDTLVHVLCDQTGGWGIVSTAQQEDPNWYPSSPFRVAVKELIASHQISVVVDIHGRRIEWPRLIEYFPNTAFKQRFASVIANTHTVSFVKNDQLTLSEDVDLQSIAALQIEVRRDGREPGSSAWLEVIEDLVQRIQSILSIIDRSTGQPLF